AHVAVGHQDVDHFFPPFDLIGVVRRSPYQTTLALFTSTVPNTTGTGRPSSAVGASKSLSSAACGWGVLGCTAYCISTLTIRTAMAAHMGIPRQSGFSKSGCHQRGSWSE